MRKNCPRAATETCRRSPSKEIWSWPNTAKVRWRSVVLLKALNDGILANPNLSEVDRNRLYTHGMARLQYLTADVKEQIAAEGLNVTVRDTRGREADAACGQLRARVLKRDDGVGNEVAGDPGLNPDA